jgi:hypothetical protein
MLCCLTIRGGFDPNASAGLSIGSGQALDDVGCIQKTEQSRDDHSIRKGPPDQVGPCSI